MHVQTFHKIITLYHLYRTPFAHWQEKKSQLSFFFLIDVFYTPLIHHIWCVSTDMQLARHCTSLFVNTVFCHPLQNLPISYFHHCVIVSEHHSWTVNSTTGPGILCDFVLTTWIPLWLLYFLQLGFEDSMNRTGPFYPL
jgi:hypothetical protein